MILPPGVSRDARLLLAARALRALCDGCVALLLPAYLLALGFGTWEVGLLSSVTLLGSALATLAVGMWGHLAGRRQLLLAAALLMAATGLLFAASSAFWPLLVVAFVGTLNPSSGDVSVFVPLEHAGLAQAAPAPARTALFARYSLIGALCAALGALAAALPDWLAGQGMDRLAALRAMFVVYGGTGLAIWLQYRSLPAHAPAQQSDPPAALGASRGVVVRMAALFSLDSFAGGLVVNALLALWLFQRFDMSLAAAGGFFFWAGLLTALSQLAARTGKPVESIEKLVVWGNHSPTMYPDIRFASVAGQNAVQAVGDPAWYRDTYIPTIGKRGAAIIEARGLSSAASAANAAIDHVRDWVHGTGGRWVTMGVPSDGSYGIPEDIVYGFPVTCAGGSYEMVRGLEIDEFSRSRMDATLKELLEERDGVRHLLG